MFFATLLLAADPPAQNQEPMGGLSGILMMAMPIMLLAYFLLVRPARAQEKQRQTMLSALKRNDKVITSGGIIGIVANIKEKEDEVTLKVDDSSNFRIRVTKSSIVRIFGAEEAAKDKEQKEAGAS